jgi:hypothetical protein
MQVQSMKKWKGMNWRIPYPQYHAGIPARTCRGPLRREDQGPDDEPQGSFIASRTACAAVSPTRSFFLSYSIKRAGEVGRGGRRMRDGSPAVNWDQGILLLSELTGVELASIFSLSSMPIGANEEVPGGGEKKAVPSFRVGEEIRKTNMRMLPFFFLFPEQGGKLEVPGLPEAKHLLKRIWVRDLQ